MINSKLNEWGERRVDIQLESGLRIFYPLSWLVGWNYRKSHVINSATGAGTNYQIRINVHYGSGTDSGADVYLNSKCRTDFGDIRFTSSSGALLDYWMESKVDSDNAVFWVEVADDLSSNPTTIYIYYGNRDATTTSNGEAAFTFFEDFPGTNIDSDWRQSYGSGNYSVSDSVLSVIGTSSPVAIASNIMWSYPKAFGFRVKITEHAYEIVQARDNVGQIDAIRLQNYGNKEWINYREGGGTTKPRVADFSTWRKVEFQWTNSKVKYCPDDTVETESTSYIPLDNLYIEFYTYLTGTRIDVDWVYVRKYVDPEPSHGSWGNEEELGRLSGWTYRKSHLLNPVPDAGTNYQVRVVVHYGNGTDNSEHVYLNGKCRSDFGDIRFTNSSGQTLLDYWMESKVDGDYAVFWVEVAETLSETIQLIYIYYGKTDATTTSNGANTFLSFRELKSDFYNALGSLYATYPNGQDPGDYFISSTQVDTVYISPCIWFRYYGGKRWSLDSTKIHFEAYVDGGNYGSCGIDIRMRTSAPPTGWQGSNTYTANSTLDKKHIIVLDYQKVFGTAGSLYYLSNWSVSDDVPGGTAAKSTSFASTTRTILEDIYAGSVAHIRIDAGAGVGIDIYAAYHCEAKYVSPEPGHGAWGSEEISLPSKILFELINLVSWNFPHWSAEAKETINLSEALGFPWYPKNIFELLSKYESLAMLSERPLWETSQLSPSALAYRKQDSLEELTFQGFLVSKFQKAIQETIGFVVGFLFTTEVHDLISFSDYIYRSCTKMASETINLLLSRALRFYFNRSETLELEDFKLFLVAKSLAGSSSLLSQIIEKMLHKLVEEIEWKLLREVED